MSVARAPLRIILLRSGGYDYAELDLQSPIHLVAANNVGKTTLIAALQYLYIDDSRRMHFSHEPRKTRQHYFPTSGSFVLFECMTPTGLQVFGLRGLGPVQGYDYERFAYGGEYDRNHYLADREPLPWEEVSRRLLSRDLRPMEPRHLRASLTGSGDANGPPLGLVPLKRSGSYDSFRFLFRNLLRLSKIEQDQLKRLFIDISRPRLRRIDVDIRREYAELFARVERDAQDVMALQVVAPSIADLVGRFEERQTIRRRLVATWQGIEETLEAERIRVNEAIEQLEAQREALDDDLQRIGQQQATARAEAAQIAEQSGVLRTRKNELESLRERTKTFVPEIESSIRIQLQDRQDTLVARLAGASKADRHQLGRELRSIRLNLSRDRKLVSRYEDAVVTWLRTHSGLTDDSLGDVFDVLNPSLLAEVLGDGRVSLDDSQAAIALVRRIDEAFGEDGFHENGVLISKRPAEAPSPLEQYQDVEQIQERLRVGEQRAQELQQALTDIEAREKLEKELYEARSSLDEAKERLRAWESWNERQEELDEASEALKHLVWSAAEVEQRQSDLQRKHTQIALQQKENDREITTLRDRLNRDANSVRRLQPPPTTWVVANPGTEIPDATLDELIRGYRADTAKQQQVAQRVEVLFGDVEHQTSGRHVGSTEDETIERLQDELSALADREKAVQDLWTSLVDGMRSAFKALVEAVDEVQREVSRLTTALGRRQVSNLEGVSLTLVRQRDLIRKLEVVIEVEDAPLFAGPGGRTRAAREIQSWLENRPRIDLAELFDLRFKVIDARSQTKTFDSLAQIESQGTSATIKVLVHLELLRMMLSDDTVAVPFFLDEVATLDEPNLRALIEHATGMGFVPVVASPEARDCVETLYFLRPGQGGLVLDETSRLRIRMENHDGS